MRVRGIPKGGGGAPLGLLRGGRVRCHWAWGSMTSMTPTWCLQMRGQRNTLDPALVPVCALFLVPRSRRTREFKTPRALWPVAACGCVFPEAIVVPGAIYGAPYIDAWVFVPVECEYFFEGGFLFFFSVIHSSKAPYQCSQEGQPNIHLDTHIPGQWSVGWPVCDADMGTPCQKIASQ